MGDVDSIPSLLPWSDVTQTVLAGKLCYDERVGAVATNRQHGIKTVDKCFDRTKPRLSSIYYLDAFIPAWLRYAKYGSASPNLCHSGLISLLGSVPFIGKSQNDFNCFLTTGSICPIASKNLSKLVSPSSLEDSVQAFLKKAIEVSNNFILVIIYAFFKNSSIVKNVAFSVTLGTIGSSPRASGSTFTSTSVVLLFGKSPSVDVETTYSFFPIELPEESKTSIVTFLVSSILISTVTSPNFNSTFSILTLINFYYI